MVFQYLTPDFLTIIGFGTISIAIMSSVKSSVISTASMFSRNIYRQNTSETEIIFVMRSTICVIFILATIMALQTPSIYELW